MYRVVQMFTLVFPLLTSGLSLILILKLKYFKRLDIPLDLGFTLKGERIFGNNKTFKGVFVMTSVSIFTSIILYIGYKNGFDLFINPIFSNTPVRIGIIYAFAYISGELINSFIKRQMNISAGQVTSSKYKYLQTFFDLSDGIIMTEVVLLINFPAFINEILIAGLVGICLHYLTDIFMKRLNLKL